MKKSWKFSIAILLCLTMLSSMILTSCNVNPSEGEEITTGEKPSEGGDTNTGEKPSEGGNTNTGEKERASFQGGHSPPLQEVGGRP